MASKRRNMFHKNKTQETTEKVQLNLSVVGVQDRRKMASKLRNMFYQNKKQETTEIGTPSFCNYTGIPAVGEAKITPTSPALNLMHQNRLRLLAITRGCPEVTPDPLGGVFSGHHSILIPPTELESNPSLWLAALSQHRVRDTFCSYEVMGYCTEELKSSVESLKTKLGSLRNVRWCIAVGGCGRARQNVLANFSRTFAPLGLKESAVAASFGCRANVAISVQNASSREPMRIYVDRKELRNDRVRIVKKSSADAECLVESGQLLPAVRLAVVNPETGRLCSSYHIGEIWVDSEHNTRNYVSPRRVQPISKDNVSRCSPDRGDTLRMVLADSDHPERQYARTGYLGFVLELDQESTETLEETDERSEAMLHPYMDNGG
ncbi:hypothetical protein AAG570_004389 [Ranatra chinensis]|uniref:AMP-dependent synthetase/ligase domain-containing protein n=1 Tax=Ranatra chinensis TaxID=642074 RepID=A0ABD0Y0R1_9HEMI